MVDGTAGGELHVPPTPTRALEEVGRVCQQGAKEKADVDVFAEDVDVSKRGVTDARGWMSVVHELAHVIATAAHAVEPRDRKRAQVVALRVQPRIDRGVVLHR